MLLLRLAGAQDVGQRRSHFPAAGQHQHPTGLRIGTMDRHQITQLHRHHPRLLVGDGLVQQGQQRRRFRLAGVQGHR
ncbi:MAG: hypothetical protein MUC91_11225, partial [Verrucomicrobia bacterium]|nr:hypothetical protein [Verrucomicrobiota bacterium]